jgi:hypothetical protein
MTQNQRDRAQRLLEAQIAYLQERISGEQFADLVETEVDHALAAAAALTLNQVVTRDQIKAVAYKYTALLQIPGSIPELIGEIAERLYSHPANDTSRIGHVIGKDYFTSAVGKALELRTLRERLLAGPYSSPLTAAWVSWVLHRVATDFLDRSRERAGRVPGVSWLLPAGQRLVGVVVPEPERTLHLRIGEFAERAARFMVRSTDPTIPASIDEAALFDAVMDLWDDHVADPVGSFRQFLSQADLEDAMVLVYEFWLSFRNTDYFAALLGEGIDFFFDKYGETSLRELLDEMGVQRKDLVEEAMRFGPPVIEVVKGNGMLAALLRRRLEPFFFSDEVLEILE